MRLYVPIAIYKIILFTIENSKSRNSFTRHKKVPVEEERLKDDYSIESLYNTWSSLLDKKPKTEEQISATVPRAPHLEDCETNTQRNMHLDNRAEDGSFPDWTVWNGSMGRMLHENLSSEVDMSEQRELGPDPPWVCNINEAF